MAWTRSVELVGNLRHGQAVEVAQGQGDPVVGAQLGQGLVGLRHVELDVPGIVPLDRGLLDQPELALLAGLAPPVVDQLVAGDPHQPGHGQVGHGALLDRGDGGEEGLGGQVLGDGLGPVRGSR